MFVVSRSDQPAPVARQIVAVLVDGVTVLLVWAFVWLTIAGRRGLDVTFIALWYSAIGALYEVTLTERFGQTVGKAVVGIAVVSVSGDSPSLRSPWCATSPTNSAVGPTSRRMTGAIGTVRV